MENHVILITGPPGAGKSTMREKLAFEYPKTATLDADIIRDILRNGRSDPWIQTKKTRHQHKLGLKNTCDLAENLISDGWFVIIDDCALWKNDVAYYYKRLEKYHLKVFLLLPDQRTVQKRDRHRKKQKIVGKRAIQLQKEFFNRIKTEKRWIILDTSKLSTRQTVEQIKEKIK